MSFFDNSPGFMLDKIIFASGYPFNHSVKDVIARFRQLPYRPEVLEKVLYHNGRRVLGLNGLR